MYINHRRCLFFLHFYPCISCALFSSVAFSSPVFLSAFVLQISVLHFQRPRENDADIVQLHGLAPRHTSLRSTHVADLFGRRPLRSAGTNRLAEHPVKLATVANQPSFPGCRSTDLERPAGRSDICRVVVHLPLATQN